MGPNRFLFTFLMLWRQCRSKSFRRKPTLVKCTDHTVHDTYTSSPSTGHKASQAHSPDDLITKTKLKHPQSKILIMLLDGSSLNYYPKHTILVSICACLKQGEPEAALQERRSEEDRATAARTVSEAIQPYEMQSLPRSSTASGGKDIMGRDKDHKEAHVVTTTPLSSHHNKRVQTSGIGPA